ncbi:hypothetical protein AAZX31_13G183100 [Glycine max]
MPMTMRATCCPLILTSRCGLWRLSSLIIRYASGEGVGSCMSLSLCRV